MTKDLAQNTLGCPESDLLKLNWLTEGDKVLNYECPTCLQQHQVKVLRRVPDEYIKNAYVHHCDCDNHSACTYKGTTPQKLGLVTKTTFEKNGRKAIRTHFDDGRTAIRSQTKENVLKGKGTKSVYTKAYQEHVNKEAHQKVVRHERMLGNEIERLNARRKK